MTKPRRNDPCTCGSGKKYKRCCGANNVIEFNPALYNIELERLNHELLEYAMTEFEPELRTHAQHYVESYLDEIDEGSMDGYLSVLLAWMIFYQPLDCGATVFDMYLAERKNKITHPRTERVFSTWKNAIPDVFKIIAVAKGEVSNITLKSLSTNQTYTYWSDDEDVNDVGSLLAGTLLPYVNSYDFFFGMLHFPEKYEEEILELLDEMKAADGMMTRDFPQLLADIIHQPDPVTIEWFDTRHEAVADLFVEHMLNKEVDEELITAGVIMWSMYCYRMHPTIQSLGANAAAIEYIVHTNFGEGYMITQSQLAKEYGTTAGSISANYRKIIECVSDEVSYHLENEGMHEEADFEPSLPTNMENLDSFNTEREIRNIQRAVENEEFDNEEEVTAFLNQLLQDGQIPDIAEEPRDIAQDLVHEARNKHGNHKKRLIEEALEMYPNTPDAYLLLAEDVDDPKEYHALLQKAVHVGEMDLGKDFFKENKGHFWGIIETRPFMRAKAAYANALNKMGFSEEAVEHYEELLELNPNDNQGVRNQLLALYIFAENYNKANKLINAYEDDITATLLFNKALVSYLTNGITSESLELLDKADDQNPYVLDYLLELKRIPDETYRYIKLGDETEAIVYAQENIFLWENADEFLEAYLTEM